ncbi:MAG: strawberry notch family protein, partial [Dehalococcoidia bacterium]|nr:strawberry notch family protein [Dehalococcoidia bacterium]
SEMTDAEIAKKLVSDRNFIIPNKPRAEVKSPIANLSEADQARMKELQAKLRQKLGGQLNAGIDPEVLVMGAEMAGLYIKGGTKTFQQFATNMKTDMTDIWDRVKRYLHGIWMTAAADNPEIEEISRADAAKVVADLDKPAAKPKMPAPRSEQTAPKPVETPAESGMKIVEQYHSKRMKNVYIVTMAERVTKDEYNVLAARARRLGGKWSREWKPTNSPAGFMFNQREHADEFVRLSQPAKAQTAPQEAEISALQTEMRELIQSEDNMQRKAIQMRQNAEKRGMTLKEYQEAVEFEIVKMADEIASDRDMPIQLRDRELVQLYELQPVLSARTSTSMELQAYSTPAPLANIGRQMIGADKADRVYEPTAGNGMLLIGIDKSKVVANELDPDRADNLRKLGVKNVTTEDASRPWAAPDGVFDAMMMNPPFGPTDTTNIDGYAIKKLEHVIALRALSRLSSNGRAFIVLGANRDPVIGDGADRTFLNYIYNNFNVAGHFEVDGDLYAKQGAKWPVRVLVIDGRRQDVPAVPENLAPKSVDRFDRWDRIFMKAEEIQDEIEKRRNSLDSGRGSRDDVRPGEGAKPASEPGVVPVAPGQDSGAANPGGRGARTGGDGTSGTSTEKQPAIRGTDDVTPEVPAPARRPAPTDRGPDSEPGGRGDAATGTPERGEGNDTAADGSDAAGRSPEVRGRTLSGAIRSRANDLLGEIVNEGQRRYIPLSKSGSLETLVPANLAQGIAESLAILEDRIGGDVDAWVADKLGYKSKDELHKAMAAEQIDAVALAIDQIEQGGALIIGDETGIGKGREAAGIIRYCQTQGIVPVFFTHNAKLFTDIYRDIQDIGSDFKPLLLGGKPSEANIVDENGKTLFRAPSGAKKSSAMRS